MMILLSGFLCNSKLENSVLSSSLNTSSVVFMISSRVGAIISTRIFNESATQVALFIIITQEGHWRRLILCARWISTARTTTTTIMTTNPIIELNFRLIRYELQCSYFYFIFKCLGKGNHVDWECRHRLILWGSSNTQNSYQTHFTSLESAMLGYMCLLWLLKL